MRYIGMQDVEPGMKIAYDIFDSFGRVMIGSQAIITERMKELLIRQGFCGIYIIDDISEDITISSVISPALRAEGLQNVRERDINGCKKVSSKIVREIIQHGSLTMDLSDLRSYSDYTYAHSVNVSVLASSVGLGLGFSEEQLEEIVLAGLVHDLGKLAIPSEILEKPERLTPEEYKVMQSHAILSRNLLEGRDDVSKEVIEAVLYHHENEDGSGYPYGLVNHEIPLYAKILHVVDVYDALISNRAYKKPYSPFEASEYLMGGSSTLFDKDIVNVFLKSVPLFPKGTPVSLSDGRKGIIFDNSGEHNLRPVVRLMDKSTLDLLDDRNFSITIRTVYDDENKVTLEYENARAKMIEQGKKYKILLLDHNAEQYAYEKKVLEKNYTVLSAKTFTQAMMLGYVKKVDAIVMDINFPGRDSVQVVERVTKHTDHNIPVVIVTERRDIDTVSACRTCGVSSYILKPFDENFLLSEVNRVVTGICES